ncbi:MAG TPA: YdcF family protein [Candidatus Binataceae bacterium]|jgi:uncharacterized SAM-binding protein YcdF (DUF218 family)|nr:YdcF family protein [Candidatus Binataceae bacterium]
MIVFLSKLLAPALSPIVIICGLLAIAIVAGRRRPRVARCAAIAAALVLLLSSNRWIAMLVTGYLELRNVPNGPLPGAQAIVVLSSGVEPAIPPQPAILLDGATANRLLYAAQLYHEGKAPVVIVSGGRTPWLKNIAPMSESMAEVMELLGVPKSAIIQEPDSANTYENAVDVKAILQARHIGRILLVTSAMHMPRALALFKHQGVDAIAAPCEFLSVSPGAGGWRGVIIGLIPDSDSLHLTSSALRELLGFAVYRAAGRL